MKNEAQRILDSYGLVPGVDKSRYKAPHAYRGTPSKKDGKAFKTLMGVIRYAQQAKRDQEILGV